MWPLNVIGKYPLKYAANCLLALIIWLQINLKILKEILEKYDFDLFILGAGSGGVRAARLASKLGKRVGIAEEYRFGGTCVIRGCVPKKLMVFASSYSKIFQESVGFGWDQKEHSFSWDKFSKRYV